MCRMVGVPRADRFVCDIYGPEMENDMDLKKALERNLSFKTEYGAGPRLLGGLFKRRVLRRRRYSIAGKQKDDTVHEREWKVGPVRVEHRSLSPKLADNDQYELAVTFFRIFAVSNDKDFWIKLRTGPSLGALGSLPFVPPAAIAGKVADLDLTARTGLRFNVSGFIRDLRDEEADPVKCDPALWDDDEDNCRTTS